MTEAEYESDFELIIDCPQLAGMIWRIYCEDFIWGHPSSRD